MNRSDQFIYVVEAQYGSFKVGVSTNVVSRIAAFHLNSPLPCRLVATWPGDFTEERAIHARLVECRTHSEWFAPVGEAARFLAEVIGRGVEAVPAWADVSHTSSVQRRAAARVRQREAMRAKWADPGIREHWLKQIKEGRDFGKIARAREQEPA